MFAALIFVLELGVWTKIAMGWQCHGCSRPVLLLCSLLWPRMQQRKASTRLRHCWFGEPQSRSLTRLCSVAATCTWSQPDTRGDPPSPRHGHVMVAVGTKLLIHGGLAGDVFYDDLFCIDTGKDGCRFLRAGAVVVHFALRETFSLKGHCSVVGREGEVCVLPHLAQLGSAAFRRVVPSSLQLALLSLSNT